ncbi:MAG: prepilin-type N-terminal cleavage/methylation domain-containing protein [Candidatus Omnitrophota bacterium]
MKRKAGFTLVELLVVISLMALIGMALYAMFGSGIGMMRRVSHSEVAEDVSVFLEKLDREVSSQVLFHGIPFDGQEASLSFPSRVGLDKRALLNKGIGRVSYFWDEWHRTFARRQENLSQIQQKEEIRAVPMLGNVARVKFQYFVYIKNKQTFEWVETWNASENAGQIPSAVKVEFECSGEDGRHVFERTLAIPIANITR